MLGTVPICRQYSRHKTTFYLVFDFCEHDLAGLLSNINVKFSLGRYRNLLTFFSYKPSYLLVTGTVTVAYSLLVENLCRIVFYPVI
jgi:hypothetical protein